MFMRCLEEVQSEFTIGLNKLCKKLLRNLKEVWKKVATFNKEFVLSLKRGFHCKKNEFLRNLFKVHKNFVKFQKCEKVPKKSLKAHRKFVKSSKEVCKKSKRISVKIRKKFVKIS